MPDDDRSAGRSGIVHTLFADCMHRPVKEPLCDLPEVLLCGPAGSGKTQVLEVLRDRCAGGDAVPHALVNCADAPTANPGWWLVQSVSRRLGGRKWPQLDTLTFPLVTLGRAAAEGELLPGDLAKGRDELISRLRPGNRPGGWAEDVLKDLDRIWPQRLPIHTLGRVLRTSAGQPDRAVEKRYDAELEWFAPHGRANQDSGWTTLVELNWDYHSPEPKSQARAARTLCQAFLADVLAQYTRKPKYEWNCALLLDNADRPAGTEFLLNVAEIRSRDDANRDPLALFATFGTVPKLNGPSRWAFPWEVVRRDDNRVPMADPDTARHSHWVRHRGSRNAPESWFYPVYLRDLAATESDRRMSDHGPFIHSLTWGHPWSVATVSAAISHRDWKRELAETDLRHLLSEHSAVTGYLLRDLSPHLYRNAVTWSAACDTAAAIRSGIGDGRTAGLLQELTDRMWLVQGRQRRTCLHPWLRRLLLRELAERGEAAWSSVHTKLRNYCAENRPGDHDVYYYDLAQGKLTEAVTYLVEQLTSIVDAETWIQEFDDITSAPCRQPPIDTAEAQYENLMHDRDGATRRDGLRNTVWSMVAARWIWSDPTGDPKLTLNGTIAHGFRELVEATGLTRFGREADTYEKNRRP